SVAVGGGLLRRRAPAPDAEPDQAEHEAGDDDGRHDASLQRAEEPAAHAREPACHIHVLVSSSSDRTLPGNPCYVPRAPVPPAPAMYGLSLGGMTPMLPADVSPRVRRAPA